MNTRILALITIIGIIAALIPTANVAQIYEANATQQPERDNENRTISVSGVSTAKVSPDSVTVSFAIESQEKTAQEATQANADVTTSVIDALRKVGLTDSEIGTSYYNVYPIYEYVPMSGECVEYGNGDQVQKYCPPPSQKQILIGYKAVNGIAIQSSQLDNIGQWIDTAIAAGANRVDYLYFSLSSQKQDEIRSDLVSNAVEDARNKAEIAIKPLGMNITDVLSIDLDNYPVIIYPKRGYETAAGAPSTVTPIIPGIQEVSATIHATFKIDGFSERGASNNTIHTSANEKFNISLDSNPSTGYQWQIKTMDQSMVKLVSNEYTPPTSGLVGAAGKQVLIFDALKEGNTMIVLEYVRSWEPENPVKTYSVGVIVSEDS